MNQLNESFQRQFVIKDVRKWLTQNIRAFIGASPTNKLIDNKIVIENPVILELPITTIEEPITTIELPVTTIELPVTTIELPITTIELPITTIEEPITTIELPITTIELPVTIELPITTIEKPVSFENIYVDNEFVSQNVFESNSHLFKDNLPNENFDEMLDIEIVYSNNSETVDSLLLDITEDHIMDLPVNVVVKKKPNKRKKK
jgi:AP2-associated kinase